MDEKKRYPFHETFFKKEWSYTTGAVLLVALATVLVVVTGSAWGVTGPLAAWLGKILSVVGINVEGWKNIGINVAAFDFWKSQPSVTNLGIVLGAFIATLLAAQFKFKKIKSWKNVAAAVIGGLLMGIGARLSLGCNIGALFSAVPAFSLHGWVFWLCIFGGAVVGSQLLKKYFL